MKTVYTKEELAAALKSGETHIVAEGEIAETLRKRNKLKKAAVIGGAAIVVIGVALAPFTAGSSIPAGLAMGLTIGTVTISTAELGIICGTGLVALGLLKDRKIMMKMKADGSVEIDLH